MNGDELYKMKIGIITFHFAHNQGAVLQCYALQKYLTNLGHEVQIIDYCPKYHTVRYDSWKNPFTYAKGFVKRKKSRSFIRKVYYALGSFALCMKMKG